jgi:hypothetical protein
VEHFACGAFSLKVSTGMVPSPLHLECVFNPQIICGPGVGGRLISSEREIVIQKRLRT